MADGLGPHEALVSILTSRNASQDDKDCAKILMKHLGRSRRVRDNQKTEIERLKAQNERLKMELGLLNHLYGDEKDD